MDGAPCNHDHETSIRVRQILDTLDKSDIRALRNALPKGARRAPVDLLASKGLFPHAAKAFLTFHYPQQSACSVLGQWAEALLQLSTEHLDVSHLTVLALQAGLDVESPAYAKVLASPTTGAFFEHVRKTRIALEQKWGAEAARYDQVVRQRTEGGMRIEGHPDVATPQGLFEIKTSSNIKRGWEYFVLQLFAYAALSPQHGHVHLVFPLQEFICSWDVSSKEQWPGREVFARLLFSAADKSHARVMSRELGHQLRQIYPIGSHRSIEGGLLPAVKTFASATPWQVFLGPSQTYKIELSDETLVQVQNEVEQRRLMLYVHAPYLINLCTPSDPSADAAKDPEKNQHIRLLQRYLSYGSACGARGVVVHVGAHRGRPVAEAVEVMRVNVMACLPFATAECPLLLETPCGEGTEVLTDAQSFGAFLASCGGANEKRLAVCVDTCHVFASGAQPSAYMSDLQKLGACVRLVHFNDSMGDLGSCVDRHEQIGRGKIGLQELESVAQHCVAHSIAMLSE